VVMYAGRKVEEAPVGELFARPRHPYTRGLMNSMPRLGAGHGARQRLQEIPGMVPSLREPLAGCAFAARCTYAVDACRAGVPPFDPKAPGHSVACFEADRLPPAVPR
jgi:peptide/nickel transport system ATP-binding protein